MRDATSVSAPGATLAPETVWQFRMPDVRFGRDAVEELPHQLRALEVDPGANILLVTDGTLVEVGHADRVVDVLADAGYDVDLYDECEREPSVEAIQDCIARAREREYDCYLGLGGGSCMDTAKAARIVVANGGEPLDYVAEPTGEGQPIEAAGAPLVCLPTTAGTGAEISPNAILSVEARETKEAISHDAVRPDAAVLDPTFTVTLPPDLTASTGLDALGHAIEGFTTHRFDELRRPADPVDRPVYAGRTPITDAFSERAIRLLAGNIRSAVHNGDDLEARSAMLRGALFGALAGLTAGANLCHAMAYPVGNRYHTFHGETIAVLTPASTLGYNAASDPERYARIAAMLGVDTEGLGDRRAAAEAKDAYVRLQRDLGVVPSGLAELTGIDESDVEWLAERTVDTQERLLRCNPRPVERSDVEAIFRDALHNWR